MTKKITFWQKSFMTILSIFMVNNTIGQTTIDNLQVDKFTTQNGTSINMFCLKHGSIIIQVSDKWIYIDPVTKAVKPETNFEQYPKADYIFVTHEHLDHLDSIAINQLATAKTTIITNIKSNEILGNGIAMKNGDTKTIESNWLIEAVPAYNKSKDKLQFHPRNRDNGYIFTIDNFRIYIAGDTEDIEEMSNISNIDVAFLPCNQPFTMSPEQLSNVATIIKPKILFPYHYGQTDIQRVVDLLKSSNIDVRIRNYQ